MKCSATYPATRKYEKAFKDSKTDSCMACANGWRKTFGKNELGPQACRKSDFNSYRRAVARKRGTGWNDLKCPKDQRLDFKTRTCYVCARGYKRTAHKANHPKACRRHIEPRASATRLGYEGFPKGSKLHIPSQVCYSCPFGTKKKLTTKLDFKKRPKICKGTPVPRLTSAQKRDVERFIDANPQLIASMMSSLRNARNKPNLLGSLTKNSANQGGQMVGQYNLKGVTRSGLNFGGIDPGKYLFTPLDAFKLSVSISIGLDVSGFVAGFSEEFGLFFDNSGNINPTGLGFQFDNTYFFHSSTDWTKGVSAGLDAQPQIGIWFVDVSQFNGASFGHTFGLSLVVGATVSLHFSYVDDELKWLGFTLGPQIGVSGEYEQLKSRTSVPKYERSLDE